MFWVVFHVIHSVVLPATCRRFRWGLLERLQRIGLGAPASLRISRYCLAWYYPLPRVPSARRQHHTACAAKTASELSAPSLLPPASLKCLVSAFRSQRPAAIFPFSIHSRWRLSDFMAALGLVAQNRGVDSSTSIPACQACSWPRAVPCWTPPLPAMATRP